MGVWRLGWEPARPPWFSFQREIKANPKAQSQRTSQSLSHPHVVRETSLGKRDLWGCLDPRYGAAKTLSPAMQGKSLVYMRWSRDLRTYQRENLILAGPPESLSFCFQHFYCTCVSMAVVALNKGVVHCLWVLLPVFRVLSVLHCTTNGMPKAPLEALCVEKNAFFRDILHVQGPDLIKPHRAVLRLWSEVISKEAKATWHWDHREASSLSIFLSIYMLCIAFLRVSEENLLSMIEGAHPKTWLFVSPWGSDVGKRTWKDLL